MSHKPVRCPKCNAELHFLLYRYEALIAEQFFVTDAGEPQHREMEISQPQQMQGTDSYSCPQCDVLITTDFEQALRLLTHQAPKEAQTMNVTDDLVVSRSLRYNIYIQERKLFDAQPITEGYLHKFSYRFNVCWKCEPDVHIDQVLTVTGRATCNCTFGFNTYIDTIEADDINQETLL